MSRRVDIARARNAIAQARYVRRTQPGPARRNIQPTSAAQMNAQATEAAMNPAK